MARPMPREAPVTKAMRALRSMLAIMLVSGRGARSSSLRPAFYLDMLAARCLTILQAEGVDVRAFVFTAPTPEALQRVLERTRDPNRAGLRALRLLVCSDVAVACREISVTHLTQTVSPSRGELVFVIRNKVVHGTVRVRFLPP